MSEISQIDETEALINGLKHEVISHRDMLIEVSNRLNCGADASELVQRIEQHLKE